MLKCILLFIWSTYKNVCVPTYSLITTLINVMVSVFASSTVYHGFEPWSCQTKDCKSGIQITKMSDTSITVIYQAHVSDCTVLEVLSSINSKREKHQNWTKNTNSMSSYMQKVRILTSFRNKIPKKNFGKKAYPPIIH